jgi:NADH-quinone oxidoreductase subunit M
MNEYHGLYEHIPMLASLFLMTGLASVGFPLTFGFVGVELLVDGAVQEYPVIGILVVVAAALNGIAVVQAYFHVFTGKRRTASFPFRARRSERFAVLALTALILGGGLWPQPGVSSRYRAAMEVIQSRRKVATPAESPQPLEHQLFLNHPE